MSFSIKEKVLKLFDNGKELSKLSFYKSFLEEPNTTKHPSSFKNNACSVSVKLLYFTDPAINLMLLRPILKVNQKIFQLK